MESINILGCEVNKKNYPNIYKSTIIDPKWAISRVRKRLYLEKLEETPENIVSALSFVESYYTVDK